eukprot:1729104-Rhodomonas_salina.3
MHATRRCGAGESAREETSAGIEACHSEARSSRAVRESRLHLKSLGLRKWQSLRAASCDFCCFDLAEAFVPSKPAPCHRHGTNVACSCHQDPLVRDGSAC